VPLGLIDHHCHGVVTQELDRGSFEALLTESPWPPAPGTATFDSQLGFAIRRWCAPVLGLAPSAPAGDYLRTRAALGAAEVNRRLLRGSQVDAWLVDTGYQADRILRPDELAEVSGMPAYRIVRLESVAEQVAGLGAGAEDFAGRFAEALAGAIAADGGTAGAAGLKSAVAYRYGLDFEPSRPAGAEVQVAAARWLRAIEAGQPPRVSDPVLLRHIIWAGLDCGLPLQFHTGFGDPDARLHRSDPSLLHDFLAATRGSGASVMLLHCYPYHRQAGYLANVFPHVYMDVGQALNHVGARSAAVLAEALELAPFHKLLYSSDAFGLAELHYLGAMGFRRDLARVLDSFVSRDAWSAADAERVAALIGTGNARRVYRLDG
jgi:hypothetical protein